MKNTYLYKTLVNQRDDLLERIRGTDGKWREIWKDELAAVLRCIAALEAA